MDLALVGLVLPEMENLSLARLASAARGAGYEATVVPFGGFTEFERSVARVLALRPRVVGVSLQTSESALAVACFARILRGRGYDGRIVVGGHFATLHAEELVALDAGIDGVVRLAGEDALVALLCGEDDADVPGLVYRDVLGAVRVGAPARTATDVLASARDTVLPRHLGVPHADLVVSRGCEHTCAYCCIPGASRLAVEESRRRGDARPESSRFVQSTAEQVADEIVQLFDTHGARAFTFMDDNLLPDGPRAVEAFARSLRSALDARRVPAISVSLQLRADAVDEASADALAALGLSRAYVGVDGYSQEQLRVLGRRAAHDDGPRAVELLAERGVFSVVNALVVGPTVPFHALEAEVAALASMRRAPVHLLPVEVRRGSALHDRAERLGLVDGTFLHRTYRFVDARTKRVGRVLLALPTRLRERSVPVAMYDLAFNLGLAARLLPGVDAPAYRAPYDRIADAWNVDQVRVLTAAIDAARAGDDAVDALIATELDRVTEHDRALLAEIDALVARLEREAAGVSRGPARAHLRSQLLGAVAFSMSLAACSVAHEPDASTDAPSASDLGATDAPASSDAPTGTDAADDAVVPTDLGGDAGSLCDDPSRLLVDFVTATMHGYHMCATGQVLAHVDAHGVVTSFEGLDADGGVVALPSDVVACLQSFFAGECFPNAAGGTAVFEPHYWIA